MNDTNTDGLFSRRIGGNTGGMEKKDRIEIATVTVGLFRNFA